MLNKIAFIYLCSSQLYNVHYNTVWIHLSPPNNTLRAQISVQITDLLFRKLDFTPNPIMRLNKSIYKQVELPSEVTGVQCFATCQS